MSDFLIKAITEGIARGIAGTLLFPLTYGMLIVLLWSARQWVEVPEVSNGQLVWLAIAITALGR